MRLILTGDHITKENNQIKLFQQTIKHDQSISNLIKTNIIDQHKHFQDADFTKLVYSTTNEEGIDLRDFRYSHHFVSDFKTRNRLSSRKAHFKKRPTTQTTTIEEFKFDIKNGFFLL